MEPSLKDIVVEKYSTDVTEKGHLKELETFLRSVRGEYDWPIPLWQQVQATRIALEVEKQIASGVTSP